MVFINQNLLTPCVIYVIFMFLITVVFYWYIITALFPVSNKTYMGLAQFFLINGFGNIPWYSLYSCYINEQINNKIHQLLSTFTYADYATIRHITLIIYIWKLNMRNIVRCGNTSCACKSSNVCTILPNFLWKWKLIFI